MAYYPISYNLPPSHYEYGYSETIESGTIRNQSGISNFTHNITISVKDPDTGDFVTVSCFPQALECSKCISLIYRDLRVTFL